MGHFKRPTIKIGRWLLLLMTLFILQQTKASNQKTYSMPAGLALSYKMESGGRVILELQNKTERHLAIITNFNSLGEKQFMGFPRGGSLQFRDNKSNILATKTGGLGWFNPTLINSTIDQPVFTNSPDFKKQPMEESKLVTLSPNGTDSIEFDWLRAVQTSQTMIQAGTPYEYRVRISVSINSEGKTMDHVVISSWIKLP